MSDGTCAHCGQEFALSTTGWRLNVEKRYCSRSCKENARKCRRDKELRAARPAPACIDCGAPRPSYKHRYCPPCAARRARPAVG